MTSGDLNIDLTRKCFYVKVVDLSTTYQMPFAVCRSDVWFSRSEGGAENPPRPESNLSEPVRNRVKLWMKIC